MLKNSKNNTLYIIRFSNTKYYKIGITNNIKQRLSSLQVGSPKKLYLYKQFTIKNRKELEKIERILHSYFNKTAHKMRGEWYFLNHYDLQQLKYIEDYLELKNLIENFKTKI